MPFATYSDYIALYDAIPETDFNRLCYDASRTIEAQTTGVDGINKLKYFFPDDADDAEAVERCCCALVNALYNIGQVTKAAGVVQREDGTFSGAGVSSISSGSESISFSSGNGSVYTKAAASEADRNVMIGSILTQYLSGVKDKNGVNLLYVGAYPYVRKNNNIV